MAPVKTTTGTVSHGQGTIDKTESNLNVFQRLLISDAIRVSYIVEIKPRNGTVKPFKSSSILNLEPSGSINSIDISSDLEFLAAATNDNTIAVINLIDTSIKHVNMVQKYGASNIKWLLTKNAAITSSTKTNNDLRMVSFDKPAHPCYFRYFKGHSSNVGSLDVSDDGRNIISAASIENRVFLWDTDVETPIASIYVSKSSNCGLGNLSKDIWTSNQRPRTVISPQPVVAFDPQNVIFAVAFRGEPDYVKLFDLRNYGKGPFKEETIDVVDKLTEKYRDLTVEKKTGTGLTDLVGDNGLIKESGLIGGTESTDLIGLTLNATESSSSNGISVTEEEESVKNEKLKLITAIGADYTSIKFSPDGKLILINTNGPYFYLLDAVTLKVKKAIARGHRQYNNTFPTSNTPEVSFVSESSFGHRIQRPETGHGHGDHGHEYYAIGGNGSIGDPRIFVWDTQTGHEVGIINSDINSDQLNCNYNLAVNYIKCPSNQLMIVTAGGHRVTMYKPSTSGVINIFGNDTLNN